MAKKKFYITTPIYYTNSFPHVGSAYTTIAADILARWHRLKGDNVFFLTGTDEHGQKIQETAEKQGVKPKDFVDKISSEFKQAFKQLNISNDNFIRTTDRDHEDDVKKTLNELWKRKYIYKGTYQSCYCIGCEQYLSESDIVNGKCPLHNREPELRKEEAYMFKLSKFQKKLLSLIKSGKYNIQPIERRNEVVSFIKTGLKDISISRLKEKVYWGIELPFDKKHTCFVWVDAFWNYLTGLKEKNQFRKFWPPEVQLMAKDILRVHATIWPALLLATKNKLPKTLFIHGYFTINGQKMSKSLGNVISPNYLVEKYGADAIRYFLVREIPFGNDGDFSETSLNSRLNNELANDLGNLVSRSLTLAEKFFNNKITKSKIDLKLNFKKIDSLIENLSLTEALNEIWHFIKNINKYINDKKPWENEKERKHVIYTVLESLRIISLLLNPFMPETSEKINKQLGIKLTNFKDIKFGLIKEYKVKKGEILFKKIEDKIEIKQTETIKNQEIKSKPMIKYEDFQKLEIKVGKIKSAKEHPNADKLLILEVDTGDKVRQIVAGLKGHYKIEELKGKEIVVLTNLEPRDLRGFKSEGMLLAASDGNKVITLTTEKEVKPGSEIR